ncbi:hypothetical protein AGLY_016284 [Aphis glycines]|uniref:Uncharacterized protein n=1 Tax=Aphis glycines TaxID=307491 RepID=A0A6G0SY84_APHGL|nr:hypothetical protein AGLY_016284 [Aphis glycines]
MTPEYPTATYLPNSSILILMDYVMVISSLPVVCRINPQKIYYTISDKTINLLDEKLILLLSTITSFIPGINSLGRLKYLITLIRDENVIKLIILIYELRNSEIVNIMIFVYYKINDCFLPPALEMLELLEPIVHFDGPCTPLHFNCKKSNGSNGVLHLSLVDMIVAPYITYTTLYNRYVFILFLTIVCLLIIVYNNNFLHNAKKLSYESQQNMCLINVLKRLHRDRRFDLSFTTAKPSLSTSISSCRHDASSVVIMVEFGDFIPNS